MRACDGTAGETGVEGLLHTDQQFNTNIPGYPAIINQVIAPAGADYG